MERESQGGALSGRREVRGRRGGTRHLDIYLVYILVPTDSKKDDICLPVGTVVKPLE